MTRPLVRRDNMAAPYRTIDATNEFLSYPDHWPEYRNGPCEPCDMLQGPCCCGAWHSLDEWQIGKVDK